MSSENSSFTKKIGLPPGAIVYVGTKKSEKVTMTEVSFSANKFEEKELKEISQCTGCTNQDNVTWLTVDGVHDTNLIKSIGKQFDLDPLMLEDIVNTKHRPKEEEFSNCLFLCLKILNVNKESKSIVYEQLSLVLSKNYLISFQERKLNILESIKSNIEHSRGDIHEKKEDYIFYRIIDTVVDNYYVVTDYLNDSLNDLEDRIIEDNKKGAQEEIFKLKKEVQSIKRSVVPLKEAIDGLVNNDNDYIDDATVKYFNDVYHDLKDVSDILDTQNEMIDSFVDLYMAIASNKMNEIMKVLTMFATIFIPLTFIAGIYGMNFDNMPILHWKYGRIFILVIMAAITIAFLIYFRKKKWL